jgi:hypothetical protein
MLEQVEISPAVGLVSSLSSNGEAKRKENDSA